MIGGGAALLILALAFIEGPAIGAGALLHPTRVALYRPMPDGCVEREFAGDEVTLRGWHCAARVERRGTVAYLHGVADNRSSAVRYRRLTQRGFDVIAYDSRAQGQSEGEARTHFYEKRDRTRHRHRGAWPGRVDRQSPVRLSRFRRRSTSRA
jgi:hypothetical protein